MSADTLLQHAIHYASEDPKRHCSSWQTLKGTLSWRCFSWGLQEYPPSDHSRNHSVFLWQFCLRLALPVEIMPLHGALRMLETTGILGRGKFRSRKV